MKETPSHDSTTWVLGWIIAFFALIGIAFGAGLIWGLLAKVFLIGSHLINHLFAL